MTYWSGAAHEEHVCTCAQTSEQCNCRMNDNVWREDSGVLTNKTHLPVKQLMFGDTDIDQDGVDEKGLYTLGKFKFLKVFLHDFSCVCFSVVVAFWMFLFLSLCFKPLPFFYRLKVPAFKGDFRCRFWTVIVINRYRWPAPGWLVSSVGRAQHWYRTGHGSKSRTGLHFFSGLISTC